MEEIKLFDETPDNKPAPKKRKGLKIAAIILFVISVLFCWAPLIGVILCIVSLILNILTVTKKQGKHIALIVLSAVFLVIALIISIAILSNTANSNVKDYAIKTISQRYNGTPSESSSLKSEKVDEDTYRVTGDMMLTKINYTEQTESVYRVQVDCTIYHPKDDSSVFELLENSSVIDKDPVTKKTLPAAITKIDKKKAVKEAERYFHETVKLKNEASYVLNDSTVSAYYMESGMISVTVVLDYSAQNSFGGMVRNDYMIVMWYSDGDYSFVGGTELS